MAPSASAAVATPGASVYVEPLAGTPSSTITSLSSLTYSSILGDDVQVVCAPDLILEGGLIYANTVGLKFELKIQGSKVFGVSFGSSLADATNTFGAVMTLRPGVWCARTSTDGVTWGDWQFDAPNYWANTGAQTMLVQDMDGTSTYWIQVFCAIPPDALNATYRLERHTLTEGEDNGWAEITGFVASSSANYLTVSTTLPGLNAVVLGDSLCTGTIELTSLSAAEQTASKLANPTVERREISTGLATYTDTIAAKIELDHRGATLDFWWLMLDSLSSTYRIQTCVLSQSGRWQGGILGSLDRAFLETTLGIYPNLWNDFADNGWKHKTVRSGGDDWTASWDPLTEGRWIPTVFMSMTHGNDIRLRPSLERLISTAQDMFTSGVGPGGTETYLTTYESFIDTVRTAFSSVKFFVLNDFVRPALVDQDTLWDQLRKLFGAPYTDSNGASQAAVSHFGARPGQADYSWIRYVDPDLDYTSTAKTTVRRGPGGVGEVDGGTLTHWAPDQHVVVQGQCQEVFDGLIGDPVAGLDYSVAGTKNPRFP